MSPIHFHTAWGGIHPAPLARPFSKGLLMERIHSLFLSFRLEYPSCAFGAALLQGPAHGADSLSFPFIPPWGDPSCAFGAALLQGPTHGADSLSFPFIPPWGIHPAPLTRPFSQSQRQLPQKEKSQLSLTLFRDRVSSREADIGHCFFLPPR